MQERGRCCSPSLFGAQLERHEDFVCSVASTKKCGRGGVGLRADVIDKRTTRIPKRHRARPALLP